MRAARLLLFLVGCAEAHAPDLDAYVPVVIDPTAEIGPRCPPLPTPCLEPSSDGRFPFEGGSVLAIDAFEDRTDVLVRIDDFTEGSNQFLLVRFERGAVTSTEIDRTSDPFSGTEGDVRSFAEHTRVTWDRCGSESVPDRCEFVETWRATVPLDGAVVAEVTSRGADRWDPRFLVLDGPELVTHTTTHGFELDDGATLSTASWPDVAPAAGYALHLDGSRWVGVVVEGIPGRIRSTAAIFDGTGIEVRPLEIEGGLSLVLGELWERRFERLDDIAARRLRVTHRATSDLSRLEPDRWLDGWGGTPPLGSVIAPYQGRPWLIMLINDVRYDPVVLHLVPLDGPACGRAVDQAAWLSNVSDRDVVTLFANETRIGVVTRSSDGIEVTSLRACE